MKDAKGRRSRTVLIITAVCVCVCVICIAVFALLYFRPFGDPAAGVEPRPRESTEETESPSFSPAAEEEPTHGEFQQLHMTEPMPPDINAYRMRLTGDELTAISIDEADISNGFLVLVNADTYYETPDNLGLVSIADVKTASYRVNGENQRLRGTIITHLNDMMDAFTNETGRDYMYIISAYRNHNAQRAELNTYINLYGETAALLYSKMPGYSEHHTGLAFDMATYADGVQYPFEHFGYTSWYVRNAYKYGFILRYPDGKTNITGTVYEPWHYRYVGLPHSYIMDRRDWVLEEYVEKIKDYTLEEPLTANYNGTDYEVYYTSSTEIVVPAQASYDISGNNVDGFIVTIFDRYDRLTNVSAE